MGHPPDREPTIRDVAARAGVSKSLVSLVLNGSPLVRPQRRAAVEAAVRDLGYRPNSAARRLSGRSLGTVGVLIHDLRQPFHADMVEALNKRFHAADLTMLLGDAQLDREADERVLNAFVNMRVDGLVLVGSLVPSADIEQAVDRLPSVVVASHDVVRPRVDIAVQDDVLGARLATEHLLDLGHRRLAHISSDVGMAITRRRESFQATVRDRAPAASGKVVMEDLSEAGGFRAARGLLGRPDRPTAVFAVADTVAVGVVRAAAELGLRVPEDVSVIGFDNASVSRDPGLLLSTVDIQLDAVAGYAVDLLRTRIADPTVRRRVRTSVPTVIARRSTGRAPVRVHRPTGTE